MRRRRLAALLQKPTDRSDWIVKGCITGIFIILLTSTFLLSGCAPAVDKMCAGEFIHPDIVGGSLCGVAGIATHYDELRDINNNGWPM